MLVRGEKECCTQWRKRGVTVEKEFARKEESRLSGERESLSKVLRGKKRKSEREGKRRGKYEVREKVCERKRER
jgi:hypothetical protein